MLGKVIVVVYEALYDQVLSNDYFMSELRMIRDDQCVVDSCRQMPGVVEQRHEQRYIDMLIERERWNDKSK